MAVPIGVHGMRHAMVGSRIVEQRAGLAEHVVMRNARQADRSGSDGLGALRLAAEHQHRLAERGRFFLQTAGVRHNEAAARHEIVHLLHIDRVDEVHARHIAELLLCAGAHGRAEVDGIDDLDVLIPLRNVSHGPQDVMHGLAIVLAAVACQNDNAAALEIQLVELCRGKAVIRAHRRAHGVDDGVARAEDLTLYGLTAQIIHIGRRWREVQRRNIADERAVHLLREGGIPVIGPQARLDMADRDLLIKGRQRPGKRRGRVAVHQNEVRLRLLQGLLHAEQGARCDGRQRLLLLHDIQVILRRQTEDLHNGVQHLAVLARKAADTLKFRPLRQRLHQRGHFDRLRPRAEDGHHLNFLHAISPPAFPWSRPACPGGDGK